MVFPTSPIVGQVFTSGGRSWVWNGSTWDSPARDNPTIVSGLQQVLYYTSSGTFTKATYPWLRAIRVKVQGAGGGSGGCAATGSSAASGSASGGGGAYAESFITNIAGLPSSVTVTRGAGGAGGAAGDNSGSTGGTSSFGSLVSANGGFGGGGSGAFAYAVFNGSSGGVAATGDFIVIGGSSGFSESTPTLVRVGGSGGSYLGNAVSPWVSFNALGSITGNLYGVGAGGAANTQNQGTARPGAGGGNGIVIVELYA
jgi:hypothetical protein